MKPIVLIYGKVRVTETLIRAFETWENYKRLKDAKECFQSYLGQTEKI